MDLNSTTKRKIAPIGCRFSCQSKRLGKIKFGSLICSAMRSNFRSPDIRLSTPLLYSTVRSVKVYFSSWKLSVQPKSHARSGPNSKSYCLIYQGYKKLMFCLTQFNCKNTSHKNFNARMIFLYQPRYQGLFRFQDVGWERGWSCINSSSN